MPEYKSPKSILEWQPLKKNNMKKISVREGNVSVREGNVHESDNNDNEQTTVSW